MKKIIVFSCVIMPGAAWAQAPAPTTDGNGHGVNPNQVVCQNIAETGSRLSHTRICMTRAQWDERRRTTRDQIERAQSTAIVAGGGG